MELERVMRLWVQEQREMEFGLQTLCGMNWSAIVDQKGESFGRWG